MVAHALDEEAIFQVARKIDSADAREPYLRQVCEGNEPLRARVDALLKVHEQEKSFLQSPDSPSLATIEELKITETPGTVIGPYKLLQEIGEGGMGVVFMADQTHPVQRKVALKIIKPGMDSRQVIARFEAERQALALMDHPNIAKVLDAGTTGEPGASAPGGTPPAHAGGSPGRPYFVMELVKGIPITKYCDDNHLTPRERLELFIPVCHAVQHAHQKGIIHRDIKPSNVLVALYDGRPVPKVIDFGVAKATSQKLTERTMFTQFGQIIGTLEYMSPEQADLNQLDIDTRSDIYSLGVLLYELLTGTTPFERKRLREAAFDELLRIIREEEPPKPSTRLSTTDELPSIAANRKTEPRKLSGLVRGELDWIVMKALEKDRNRRYETANGFAMDIQRYLSDESVQACPPSAAYRFRKFARRNRASMLTATLISGALVLGIVGSTWQAIRANRERDDAERARQAEAVQSGIAEQQRTEAEKQRKQAEANYRKARQAVDDFFTIVSEDKLLNTPGVQSLRKELLETALVYYKEFIEQRADDPKVQAELAGAYFRVGAITDAIGSKDDALAAHGKAREIREKLASENPTVTEYQADLAWSYNMIGKLQHATGLSGEALRSYEKAHEIREKLARENPTVTEYGRDLAASFNNIGILLGATGQWAERYRADEKAREIREKLVHENPTVTQYRSDLAASYNNIGYLQSETGHSAAALSSHEKAREIREKLARENPLVTEYHQDLAGSYSNIGYVQSKTGQSAAALSSHEKAREIHEKLAQENPAVTMYQNDLAASYSGIGVVQRATGQSAAALGSHEKAREIREKLARDNPTVTQYRSDLARSYTNIGQLQGQTDHQRAEALRSYEKAREICEKLARDNPTVTRYQNDLAQSYSNIGFMQAMAGQPDEAIRSYEKVREIMEQLARENPTVTDYQSNLAASYSGIGGSQRESGETAESLRSYEKAREILQKLTRENPIVTKYQRDLAYMYHQLGYLLRQTGQTTEALGSLQQAVVLWEKFGSKNPYDLYNNACSLALMASLIGYGKAELSAEDQLERRRYADRAVALLHAAVAAGLNNFRYMQKDRDLDAIRDHPGYKELIEKRD